MAPRPSPAFLADGFDIRHLHDAVAAVCPITGIQVPRPYAAASVVIDFDPAATPAQRTAARAVVNGYAFMGRRSKTRAAVVADLRARGMAESDIVLHAVATILIERPALARELALVVDDPVPIIVVTIP